MHARQVVVRHGHHQVVLEVVVHVVGRDEQALERARERGAGVPQGLTLTMMVNPSVAPQGLLSVALSGSTVDGIDAVASTQ